MLYGCADLYTMLCRNRWAGLEQEGFGIVFLEAASCEVAPGRRRLGWGRRRGRRRRHRRDGPPPRRPREAAAAFARLLDDPELRHGMGRAGRVRAVAEFSYDGLARRLGASFEAPAMMAGR